MRPVTMDEVRETPTHRFSSTSPELDKVFGSTRFYNAQRQVIAEEWGIARGKVVAMGGPEGIGKTRFYTRVAIMLAEAGIKSVIFQKEMKAGEYKELLMNMYRSLNIEPRGLKNIVFEQTTLLERQLDLINEIKPDLAIDDSFNMTTDPNPQTKTGIQKIVMGWKAAMGEHTAGWMISHLNAAGGLMGHGHFKYLVDGVLLFHFANTPETRYEEAHPECLKERYKMAFGKTRQGERGICAYLRHVGDHTEVISDKEVLKWINGDGGAASSASASPAPKASIRVQTASEIRAKVAEGMRKVWPDFK